VAPLLIVLGVLALLAGTALIASFGDRLHVGRLLARTQPVDLAEVHGLATSGRPPYVRIEGRIDSEDEFEDIAHRPLVFRRTLVQMRRGFGWRTLDEGREAVPFAIADAHGQVAIDPDDLGVGLIVVPREAVGIVADVADRVPADLPRDAPVRVRIDQVSSIEHAIVLGVPSIGPSGAVLRPAPGRPLVLTTLEPPEAMRVLADGRQDVIRLAVGLLVSGAVAVALGAALAVVGIGR
jgi:hypothetical protein